MTNKQAPVIRMFPDLQLPVKEVVVEEVKAEETPVEEVVSKQKKKAKE